VTRKLKIALATVVAGLVLLVGGAEYYLNHEGAQLRALRADPMATFVPPGAKQTYRGDAHDGRVAIAGPTGDARIHRTIASCDRKCYDAIVERAQGVGWRMTRQFDGSSILEREVAAGSLGLLIREHDTSDRSAVGIWLSFGKPET
jgi:hypothetical protein